MERKWIAPVALALLALPTLASAQSTDRIENEARSGYEAVMQGLGKVFRNNTVTPEDMTRLLTEDFVLIMPNGQPIRGRAGLEGFFRSVNAWASVSDWSFETESFHSDGRFAYARGVETTTGTAKKDGKPITEAVQFLAVYQRQPDGRWLLQSAMNTRMPPKPVTP